MIFVQTNKSMPDATLIQPDQIRKMIRVRNTPLNSEYDKLKKMKKPVILLLIIPGIFLLQGCNLVDSITGKKNDTIENILHPVILNGKWGYINNAGQIRISPEFDDAKPFSNDMAAVRMGTLWGYVQASTASLVIEPQFKSAGSFEDGLAPVQLPGQQYGYISTRGQFVIEPVYDFASSFSDGFASVRTDNLWGYITPDGSSLVIPKYSDARNFSDGMAAVEKSDGWIYINSSGQEVTNSNFRIKTAGEFMEGLAPIQTDTGWGYINNQGRVVITPGYTGAGSFSQGRAWVRKGNYIGFIDKDEKSVVEPQFAQARSFSEDMAAVRLNNSWFYLSRKNNLIAIPKPFTDAENFYDGIARVRIDEGSTARYGYINKRGEYVWFPSR